MYDNVNNTNDLSPEELKEIVDALSATAEMWLVTVTIDPMLTKEAREEVYGPDWHSSDNWARLCKDQDDLLRAGLIVQTLPLERSTTFLTNRGVVVRRFIEENV